MRYPCSLFIRQRVYAIFWYDIVTLSFLSVGANTGQEHIQTRTRTHTHLDLADRLVGERKHFVTVNLVSKYG